MIINMLFCLSGILSSAPATGCQSGNCIHGEGVYLFASGARYEGTFMLGKRQGKGTLTLSNGVVYQGQFSRDFREGTGRQTVGDGSVYTGQFQRDRYHGKGTMVFADGSVYRGDWQAGTMHGQGELIQKEGDRYVGAFRHGRKEGQGIQIDRFGHQTEGTWVNNEFQESPDRVTRQTMSQQPGTDEQKELKQELAAWVHPSGSTYTYQDGSQYQGTLVNGLPEGRGTCRYMNGDRYEGGWSRHAPHGEGTLLLADGRRLQGHWVYGRLAKLTAPTQPIEGMNVQPVLDERIRIWAVVAGVAPYLHMPTLTYPDDDAYQMYAFLRSPEGGALPESQIRLLINEDATRANLIEAIQMMFGQADENDVVLFYFSGHGLDGAILPADFDGFDNRLFYAELTNLLEASRARQKLVMTDACYSGSLMAAKGGGDAMDNRLVIELEKCGSGTALMMSSQQEEYSLEDKGLRAGVFSYYLRQGLKGQADRDGDGIVRIGELFSFVQAQVRARTRERQTPVLKGTFDENMPLAYLRPRG